MVSARSVRWGWIAAAAAAVVVAVVLAATWQGACFDAADTAASSCSYGPVLGVPGTVVMVVLAAGFVVFAVVRAFRKPTG